MALGLFLHCSRPQASRRFAPFHYCLCVYCVLVCVFVHACIHTYIDTDVNVSYSSDVLGLFVRIYREHVYAKNTYVHVYGAVPAGTWMHV